MAEGVKEERVPQMALLSQIQLCESCMVLTGRRSVLRNMLVQ